MGKLVLRALVGDKGGEGCPDAEIVLLNDKAGDPAAHAHLLEFDSVHGRWDALLEPGEDDLAINGRSVRVTAAERIEDLPLAALGVDLVIDCTGKFKTPALVQPYYLMVSGLFGALGLFEWKGKRHLWGRRRG